MWHKHMVKSASFFLFSADISWKLSIWNAVNPIVFHNASGYELRGILPVLHLTALHFYGAFGGVFTGNKSILRSLHLLSATTWFLPATANRPDTFWLKCVDVQHFYLCYGTNILIKNYFKLNFTHFQTPYISGE